MDRTADLTKQGRWAWLSATFVWSVWAVTLLSGLAFVCKFGNPFPVWECWYQFVPWLTGHEPITLQWLWSQEVEHRPFLMRAIVITLLKLTGGDFRAPVFFDIAALGALAFAMILTARRLRGWILFADAIFPLALLHWGVSTALYASENIYLLPSLVAGVILLILVQRGAQLTPRYGLLAGMCLVLLPLCGATGMVYMPVLTVWLTYSAVISRRSPEPRVRRNSLIMLFLIGIAVLLALLYFVGYERQAAWAERPSPALVWPTLKGGLAFLTASFGRATARLWPASGLGMAILFTLSVAALLALAWKNRAEERSRPLGVLIFMGALSTLTVAVGWARGNLHDIGTVISQYDLLAVPALCCVYYVWVIYKPQLVGQVVQILLFAITAVSFSINVHAGFDSGTKLHGAVASFERDLRAGEPAYVLIARYGNDLGVFSDRTEWVRSMHMLREARIGVFQYLQDAPPFRETPFPLVPIMVKEAQWLKGTVRTRGAEAFVTFALPEPTYVAGIRIRGTHSGAWPLPQLAWRKRGESDFPQTPQINVFGWADPITIYVADTIDQIRIYPDARPCDLKILEMVLLVPE